MEIDRAFPYVPSPIRTEEIRLSGDLEDLLEALAKNAHDVWALQRYKDEWRWGPSRNDEAKTHPNLVPYEALADDVKDYDRVLVKNTLCAIVALGYRISKDA